MPLETGTYISDLNASNPVGSTDKVQTLDDHVRLLKSTVKASFPGVTGAVTATHTELNFVDGVTSAIQTQLDAKLTSASNLNASNLASGTVPDARFPATLPAISGANLTNLDASDLASGTVPDARLSSQVVLKDSAISSVDNGDVADPGYRGVPFNVQSSDYTCVLADAGKTIMAESSCTTITIPATASVAYPTGTVLTFVNNHGSLSISIAITSDSMYLAGTVFGTSGTRTLARGGMATAVKLNSTNWLISGAGLS